ncbi:MAG: hypothetical protein J1F35_06435 [Erysipelotrichales bacterium]|nr:hypothetical protein [Erysipelotrichales bacterium]
MAVKRKTEDELSMEEILAGQIPEAPEGYGPEFYGDEEDTSDIVESTEPENIQNHENAEQEAPQRDMSQLGMVGTKLTHNFNQHDPNARENDAKLAEAKGLSKLGENIKQNVEVRDGWIHMDKALLGERADFYPESWEFMIRPATVDAIRNWSTVDEENPLNVDDVFNEILKYCLAIKTPTGPQPWSQINSWDKFWFVLMIRAYTFKQGEQSISWNEDCVNCDAPVDFKLDFESLMYDLPDPEVMRYYDRESRTWMIDPAEYDLPDAPITLYNPTVEKDANIKAWMINKYQENRNAKVEGNFVKFLTWLAPKISKDQEIAKRQIKEYQMKYKSWDMDMFTFMEDVVKNIAVTPSTNISAICPSCGEEVTAQIRFPNGISDLFNVRRKSRKFGKK